MGKYILKIIHARKDNTHFRLYFILFLITEYRNVMIIYEYSLLSSCLKFQGKIKQ